MFESTRLKLTAWYLLITMTVSFLFSLFIYASVNTEYRRLEKIEYIVQDQRSQGLPIPKALLYARVDPVLINAARNRLISTLGMVNLAIFGLAGLAGYFLAGRTLKPIREMVDELNRFVSDASHELRTPLTSLRSEMEVNLLNKKLNITQAKKIIESNLEEVIHLQTLSDNLLELTNYEKGQMNRSNFQLLQLHEVVNDAIKNVQGTAMKNKIKIENNIGKFSLEGSKGCLRELFTVLLDNAIKYSNSDTKVSIDAKSIDHFVEIKVTDRGIGIAKSDMPYIFDRFYRADKSRSKQIEGFGLGLSIAKKIIDLHKGTIEVKSKVNSGTSFIIRIPKK